MKSPASAVDKANSSHVAEDAPTHFPPKPANPFVIHDDQPSTQNKTMLQGFEWYCPADHKHWKRLAKALPGLASLGITSMWIPPATKATRPESNGYDIYDLYDLGEFNQKGTRPTKWGTKDELVDLVKIANLNGIGILFDTVLNHKAGADYTEHVEATMVDSNDRRKPVGKSKKIEAWTGFDFKGRAGTFSSMKWNKTHFTGVDWDQKSKTKAIWKFKDKTWAADVDGELGNYDYLMFADIDHKNLEVRLDLARWVEWLGLQLKLGGLRLDAVKHYSRDFVREFLLFIDRKVDKDWFIVGEYWRADSEILSKYIEFMNNRLSLFDVKLVTNFSRLSLQEGSDLRTVFDGSLVTYKPLNAVTFVANHDTQEGQSLETPVAPYFTLIAYSLILLRVNSGLPCVFYADLYGSFGRSHKPDQSNFVPPMSGGGVLPKMILTRNLYAYGTQYDYFDQAHCIGFTRLGHPSQARGAGLAAVMTNSWEFATKRMYVGKQHAGEIWTDILRWCWGEIIIDATGWGVFHVGPRSVSVWVSKTADGRELLNHFVFEHDIYGLNHSDAKRKW